MEERRKKRVQDSRSEQSHLIMPKDLNSSGYLFGGMLLAWIDELAGLVGRRHSEMDVLTVAVDNMYFKEGAREDDTVVLIGKITYVGRSSMEVRIDTYLEARDGMRHMINRAYFVMVGVDENRRPQEVPGLVVESVSEKMEWEAGEKRAELRKQRRKEGF
ncbi:MAG: acyl-CoA thioesterase [Eubacteriales bacterium]|nr:acyl-CoA thioesterase [Eubacteriales bacterium]